MVYVSNQGMVYGAGGDPLGIPMQTADGVVPVYSSGGVGGHPQTVQMPWWWCNASSHSATNVPSSYGWGCEHTAPNGPSADIWSSGRSSSNGPGSANKKSPRT